MKITFLGTSHGVPSRGRNCSAAMLEIGESIYFIDGGAPLIEEFLKIKTEADLKKIRAIFTTHAHSDHTLGILHMASLMDWFYKLPLDIYLTENKLIEAMNNLFSATISDFRGFNPDLIKFHLETDEFVYDDKNVKISFIPTAHLVDYGRPTYAILLEAEGKRVLFSGDLSYRLLKNDMPKIVTEEHLDLFVCEMAHFGLEELRPTLDRCKAERVYVNHVCDESKFEQIRQVAKDYSFEFGTLNDGDVIEL